MASKTFSTNLETNRRRLSKWLFLVGGLFLVITQGYNVYISADFLYLGGLAVGIWILGQGLFFTYFNNSISLTLDENSLTHHCSKTLFKDKITTTIRWKNILKIVLSNYGIHVTLKNGSTSSYSLPPFERPQIAALKTLLKRYAQNYKFTFIVVRWWKKLKVMTAREAKRNEPVPKEAETVDVKTSKRIAK